MTSLLKSSITDQYNSLLQDIKKKIVEEDYDYTLTMEVFEKNGNPFRKVNYIEILAAYMTAKAHAKESGGKVTYVSEIPFIEYSIKDAFSEEISPAKYSTYASINETSEGNELYAEFSSEYAYEEKEIDNFKLFDSERRLYIKDGTKVISPSTVRKKYAEVEYSILTPEKLIAKLGFNFESLKEDYERRKQELEDIVTDKEYIQSIFIKIPDGEEYTYTIPGDITDPKRKSVLLTATSLIGKVPYQWGGKPRMAGLDPLWWTFNDEDEQVGLDCSGFVEWAFKTAGLENLSQKLHSTSSILAAGLKQISKDELKPGDIGILNHGEKTNHTGIYLGDNKWIHCSSSADTVIVSEFNFTIFYDPITDTEEEEPYVTDEEGSSVDLVKKLYYTTNQNYSSKDAYLLAQLISHEAKGEGLNGWIGVGEVVKNRVESSYFPNTVEDVIYQEGQFTNVKNLSSITPSDEIIKVAEQILKGSLQILGNKNVLFFRNPKITNEIDPDENVNWGNHSYYMAIGRHAFYLM